MEANCLNRLSETDSITATVYGFCRCCLMKGKHQDITKVHIANGKQRENFEDIILDCFNLFLSTNSKLPNLICSICIGQLNNVRAFKEKLIETEQKLLGALSQLNGQVDLENGHEPEKNLDTTIGVKTKVNNDTNNKNKRNTSKLVKANTKTNDQHPFIKTNIIAKSNYQHSFISVNNIANSNNQLPFKTVNYVANSNNQQSYIQVYIDAVIANSNKKHPLVRVNDTNLISQCSFIGVNNIANSNNQHTFRGVNNVANWNNQLKIVGVNSYANLNDQHIKANDNANSNDQHPFKGVNNATNMNNTHQFIQVNVDANSNDQHIKVNDNANSNDEDPLREVNDDVNSNGQHSFKEENEDTSIDLSPYIGGQADSNSNDHDPLRGVIKNVDLNDQKTLCEDDDTVNDQRPFTKENKDKYYAVLYTQQPDSAMEHHPVENVNHQETEVKPEIQDELEIKDELEIHDELGIKDEPVIQDKPKVQYLSEKQDVPEIQDVPGKQYVPETQDVLKIQDEPEHMTITETSALVGNTCNLLEYSNATLIKTKMENGFKCFYCNEKIENIDALRQHQTEHSRGELFKILQKYKVEDLSVYAEVTDLKCLICSMKMNNFKDLRAHLIKAHRLYFFQKYTDRIIPFKMLRNLCFQCTICNAYSASFTAIESHLRYHIIRQRMRSHDHTIKVDTRHAPKTRLRRHRPYPAPPPLKSTSENEKADTA